MRSALARGVTSMGFFWLKKPPTKTAPPPPKNSQE
jgi:hypothetical protein